MEVEKSFQAPVATERFVWSANPKTGRVAVIDSQTYQVKTAAAGQGPTFVAAIPGREDHAIVLNVLSNDATYFTQNADGTLDQKTFQIAPRANAWAISPNGRWAIAWTDVSRVAKPDVIDGFQQISIIDLQTADAPSRAPVRTVGFRPSSISFSSDDSHAFAVTEDGITVLDLSVAGNPQVVNTLKLDPPEPAPLQVSGVAPDLTDAQLDIDAGLDASSGDADAGVPDASDAAADVSRGDAADASARGDASDAGAAADRNALPDAPAPDASTPNPPPGKADVSITPKGDYAIVRRDNSPVVTVINLADGSRWSWTLSGPVTDLDLSDTGDRAVAVVRSQSRVAVLPVPGSAQAPFDDVLIDGETVGSVVIAPQGKAAVLYTNAVPVSRLTVLGLAGRPAYNTIALHAPVLSVFASPSAQHALVIHNSFNGMAFTSPGAFSVVSLSGNQSPVIQPTDATPLLVAFSPSGDRVLVPVRDDTKRIFGVYLATTASLVADRYPLASPPTSAGFVGAAGQAFIAQDHPEGRITFIDSSSGLVRTITGFELGASVVIWSRDGGR
jgi:hypothetical protein